MSKIKKSSGKRETFILILLLQVLLSLLAVVYFSYGELGLFDAYYSYISPTYFLAILITICAIIGILALYWFKEMEIMSDQQKSYELQATKLRQMQEANDLLNSQKHDFLNSLQVIWGLALMNDKDKVLNYIQTLTDSLKFEKIEITEINKDENPYLYTLFVNKLHKCKDLGIDIELNFYETKYLNAINPIDLVNILGNLLDNAIYEVKKLPDELRKICVDIYREEDEMTIEVFNKGPKIEQKIMDRMFDRGFTTKGNEGTGFGLYNVRSMVEKYGGKIGVVSDEEYGTNFTITFKLSREHREVC